MFDSFTFAPLFTKRLGVSKTEPEFTKTAAFAQFWFARAGADCREVGHEEVWSPRGGGNRKFQGRSPCEVRHKLSIPCFRFIASHLGAGSSQTNHGSACDSQHFFCARTARPGQFYCSKVGADAGELTSRIPVSSTRAVQQFVEIKLRSNVSAAFKSKFPISCTTDWYLSLFSICMGKSHRTEKAAQGSGLKRRISRPDLLVGTVFVHFICLARVQNSNLRVVSHSLPLPTRIFFDSLNNNHKPSSLTQCAATKNLTNRKSLLHFCEGFVCNT